MTHRRLLRFALVPLALVVAGRQAWAQRVPEYRWRLAIGISVGTPGGFGGLIEAQPVRRITVRLVARGLVGTVPRGGGLTVALAQGSEGRLYLSSSVGSIQCLGDTDGVCSGKPTSASSALSAGIGGEFPVSSGQRAAVGVDLERWFASTSGQQPSLYVAVFVLHLRL